MDMDKEPIEYSVEAGTTPNLILPEVQDESRMSLREREEQQKTKKTLDAQFSRVPEFSDGAKPLLDDINVIGIASSYLNLIKLDNLSK